MDDKYLLGIAEIDAQHKEIDKLVYSLREVIAQKDQRRLAHTGLKRLHQLLETHFMYEEAMMKMVNYADLPQHAKMHQGVLQLFIEYLNSPPEPGDHDRLGKLITDKVLGHIMEHDTKMSESVKEYLGRSSTPAGRVNG